MLLELRASGQISVRTHMISPVGRMETMNESKASEIEECGRDDDGLLRADDGPRTEMSLLTDDRKQRCRE